MPISYRIDVDLGAVFTHATGALTDDELIAHKRDLTRDPAFKPGMVELSDLRGLERLDITSAGVSRFVAQDESDANQLAGVRMAIVASEDLAYGMSRMYGMRTGQNVDVQSFRDIDEARRWLGLPT